MNIFAYNYNKKGNGDSSYKLTKFCATVCVNLLHIHSMHEKQQTLIMLVWNTRTETSTGCVNKTVHQQTTNSDLVRIFIFSYGVFLTKHNYHIEQLLKQLAGKTFIIIYVINYIYFKAARY